MIDKTNIIKVIPGDGVSEKFFGYVKSSPKTFGVRTDGGDKQQTYIVFDIETGRDRIAMQISKPTESELFDIKTNTRKYKYRDHIDDSK